MQACSAVRQTSSAIALTVSGRKKAQAAVHSEPGGVQQEGQRQELQQFLERANQVVHTCVSMSAGMLQCLMSLQAILSHDCLDL